MSRTARNPVLRGFMPDASAVQIGDSFLLANSSFEWFPTLPLHRSRNLIDWSYAGSIALEGIDLRGVADSCGYWAPSLSVAGGSVYVVVSVVATSEGGEKDIRTYVSRSHDDGASWEPPHRVPSTGFDPALFHHDDRTWLLNMRWDSRPDRWSFAGITAQELNRETLQPLEEPRTILTTGTLIEGPGLEYRDGWFWLSVAEGGTGWEHGITMYRSRGLHGPYERDPRGSYLTTRGTPDHWAQKAGHGEILTLATGERVLLHLGSRVLRRDGERHGILGRETFVEHIVLDDDGWPRLRDGGTEPTEVFDLPDAFPSIIGMPDTDGFGSGDTPEWPWSTLRRPADNSWADLTAAPGRLRLRGGDSLHSRFEQSLVARRLREFPSEAGVVVRAQPRQPTDAAGLVLWYDTSTYAALLLSCDDDGRRILTLRSRDAGDRPVDLGSAIAPDGAVHMRLRFDEGGAYFAWAGADGAWTPIGTAIEAARFSDDHRGLLRFTGPMVGVTAIDTVNGSWTADFEPLRIDERPVADR